MSSASTSNSFDVDAILAGAGAQLAELLRRQPADAETLAAAFWDAWRTHAGLHGELLAACEPLAPALAELDAAHWAAAHEHDVWKMLALVQQSGIGYQPELGRAGERILAELGSAVQQAGSAGWKASVAALETWWAQEQQRLARLEQRLVDTERGQLRSRRAHLVAARLLNQTMAGKQFAREVADYLQREWFQELQWALLQFGAESEQWQRRARLTERLVGSLQPPEDDDEARQHLYALIPDVGAELAAVLDERAHDRAVLEQQLALIETQHLLLLRGKVPPPADFQLIANDDPWLSSMTISASLLQRVAVLEAGSWFALRDGDGESRIKLVLKLDDSTQLLFVNRLGVKALQKSFEEFAYLLSVGAARQLPGPACARDALRVVLEQLAQRSVDDQHERAEARRLADAEARLRVEAKAKAIAEANALAQAHARAEQEAAQRVREERVAALEQQRLEQEQAQELARRQQVAEQERARQLDIERQQREAAEAEARQRAAVEVPASAAPVPPEPVPVRELTPADEQRQRAARREAGLMPLGTWIELRGEDDVVRRLKVAVKLPSSGKLILVDRDGVRQAELERDVFANLLFEERARILNQGPKFEDTLAKVVDSMRRDRAPRE